MSPRSKSIILAVALGTSACEGAPEEVEIQDVPTVNPLLIDSATSTWANGKMPVCWANPGFGNFASLSLATRNAALSSWPEVAKIDFTGWGNCGSNVNGIYQVKYDMNANSNAGGFGSFGGTRTMNLGNDAQSSATVQGVTAHEFGHGIGFRHEFARDDFTSNCTMKREGGTTGNKVGTPANDTASVMLFTYCNTSNPNLSPWDVIGVQRAYGKRGSTFAAASTYWSGGNEDHGLAISNTDITDIERRRDYRPAYTEGWIATKQLPGTVALRLFFNSTRGDYFSSTDATPPPGYTTIGVQGFVFQTQEPGTVPLKLFWHGGRSDNLTTSNPSAINAALAAGYFEVRTVGFVFSSIPYKVLRWYFHNNRGDNLVAPTGSTLASAADSAAYMYVGHDAAVLVNQVQGTVPLFNYWSSTRADNFQSTLTTAPPGYVQSETLGFVYSSSNAGTVSLRKFWHNGREDNFLTGTTAGVNAATSSGYVDVGVEAHGIPVN